MKRHLSVGMDCAIEIWRRTPGDAWLARLFGEPVVHSVARVAYNQFADLLNVWNRRSNLWSLRLGAEEHTTLANESIRSRPVGLWMV
jgi:predicted DCC family thiol-disulfide oxidoreductase YuxK